MTKYYKNPIFTGELHHDVLITRSQNKAGHDAPSVCIRYLYPAGTKVGNYGSVQCLGVVGSRLAIFILFLHFYIFFRASKMHLSSFYKQNNHKYHF